MTGGLRYDVTTERREGLVRDLPPGQDEWRWVANAATLVWDARGAVLIDTFPTIDQNARLIEWIRAHDVELSAVYVTHGHGDHGFGIAQLRDAFPSARMLATQATIAGLEQQAAPALRDGFWGRLFPGQIPDIELPDPLDGEYFEVGGHRFQVIETGFTDTPGSTVLWVPALRLIGAGDVVYNATHPYLAETTPQSRLEWVAALRLLASLEPEIVVSAHKQPDRPDAPSDIRATIRYLQDVAETDAVTATALEFYERMLVAQPGRANVGSLWGTATHLKGVG